MRFSFIIFFLGWYKRTENLKGVEGQAGWNKVLVPDPSYQVATNRIISFLTGWITRQSRGQAYPSPSISVTPSERLTMGGHATISCESECPDIKEFRIHKGTNSSYMYRLEVMAESRALFTIVNARESDAGIYWCQYCVSDQSCSNFSDKVSISVKGKSSQAGSTTVIWASSAVGLLILLLLLVAFLLYRQRRAGLTVRERQQPVNTPMKTNIGAEQDRVIYAEVKTVQSADPARVSEQCTYASVAKGRNMVGQRQSDSFGH